MEQYIPKSALVAEIERRIAEYKEMKIDSSYYEGMVASLEFFRDEFIDTIEVKEVDLEHEVESYWKQCDMTWCRDAYSMTHIRSMLSDIAKHFFELGMQVRNKAQKGE